MHTFHSRHPQIPAGDGRDPTMKNKNRIGILTGGGDCPGLNAVIRGAVKSADRLGYDMVGFHLANRLASRPTQDAL